MRVRRARDPSRVPQLAIILQKLLIIAIVIFFYDLLVPASILVSLVHACFFVTSLVTRPYFDPKSDALNSAILFASMINPLVIVLSYYGVTNNWDTELVTGFIILINFGLPILALAVGWFFSVRSRRQMIKRQDVIEEKLTQQEVDAIEKTRRELDYELDSLTLKYVLRVFVVMAAAGFLSIAVLLLGQFWQAATAVVIAPTAPALGDIFVDLYAECEIEELVTNNHFARYADWKDFTRHCCCADRQSEASFGIDFEPGQVELWHCDNGLYKERDRSSKDDLNIRDFCAPTFNAGYSFPKYSESARMLVVEGPDGEEYLTGW